MEFKGPYPQDTLFSSINRRDFMKFCTAVAATLGLPMSAGVKIAEAVTSPERPPVIWLSGQQCTGCVEMLLRTDHPSIDSLIFNLISLEYSETLNAGSGHQAEAALQQSIERYTGQFILVVDGSIPVKDGGIYCQIAGRPVLDILNEMATQAAAVIAIGSCASWGGIPAAEPNPTGATPVHAVLKPKGISVVNIPGCPPNPINIVGTIVHYITEKTIPELDDQGRPNMFFGTSVHDQCERLPHFEAGEFADSFDSDEARKGWCLYNLGCKGPKTYNNCPKVLFNGVNWPVGAGHPCIGCSEPNFWDDMSPFYES